MRFCSIADIHGKLKLSIDKCDILCICGDIVPLNIQRNDDLSYIWLETKFLNWVNKQPCDKVLLIGGNHDFAIYNNPDRVREIFKDTKVEYLFDNEFVYHYGDGKQLKFYGSPWCHKFYDWAYMDFDEEQLKEIFLGMPNDVDVLMTHDCPYGACDVLLQDIWWADGTHIGSIGLTEAVIEKKPRVMITGHLHSANKIGEPLGETMVYNTSVVDETYEMVYVPHYFEAGDDGEIVLINKEDFV